MVTCDLQLSSLASGAGAAVFLFAAAFTGATEVRADPVPGDSMIAMPHFAPPGLVPQLVPPVRAHIEPGDEVAALDAIEIALTQAGDGSTYVWRHGSGRLAGAVRMNGTFRDVEGRICRHLEMQMRLGTYTRKTEGIACRGADGVWLLEG